MRIQRLVLLVWLACCGAGVSRADAPGETVAAEPKGIESRLMHGDFAELDRIADDYRSQHTKIAGGRWALNSVYKDMARLTDDCGPCSQETSAYGFEQKRQAFEHWLHQNPNSLTAKVGLAYLWRIYAAVGRGANWAPKTTPEQFQALADRQKKSLEILRALDADADPNIYKLEMNQLDDADDPKAALNALYAKATQAFPDFPEFAALRYRYLQPRWFGEAGEAQAFAGALHGKAETATGRDAYFEVAYAAIDPASGYAPLVANSGLAYGDVVHAFAARSAAYGPLKLDMNVLFFWAVAAADKHTAAMLAEKIGADWDRSVWSYKYNYDAAVMWSKSWL